ncbi:hypothetical protein NL676_035711 [Syzygium grande]|nr:hypothetical protein NL676_035711 [Syzygium grande]
MKEHELFVHTGGQLIMQEVKRFPGPHRSSQACYDQLGIHQLQRPSHGHDGFYSFLLAFPVSWAEGFLTLVHEQLVDDSFLLIFLVTLIVKQYLQATSRIIPSPTS